MRWRDTEGREGQWCYCVRRTSENDNEAGIGIQTKGRGAKGILIRDNENRKIPNSSYGSYAIGLL